jgi:hypothetical protein
VVTFLFWNVGRADRREIVARLVVRHSVDVLMLVESTCPPNEMLATVQGAAPSFEVDISVAERIHVFTRFPQNRMRPLREHGRYSIRRLALDGKPEIVLAIAHLPSKLHQSDDSQIALAMVLAEHLRTVEAEVGHRRTVLVGDLNMNPFEIGVVAANGLHAVMDRLTAERGSRDIHGVSYPFFYNPMWSLLGDASRGPPGTYFRPGSEYVAFFWNMLDQLLVRPDLLASFKNEELEILTSDGQSSLVTLRQRPDAENASDHLPLLFRLHL